MDDLKALGKIVKGLEDYHHEQVIRLAGRETEVEKEMRSYHIGGRQMAQTIQQIIKERE